MRQQKSHDIDQALRADTKRLAFTLLAVAIIVAGLYLVQEKFHLVERFIVLPQPSVATAPSPVTLQQPQQTPSTEAQK